MRILKWFIFYCQTVRVTSESSPCSNIFTQLQCFLAVILFYSLSGLYSLDLTLTLSFVLCSMLGVWHFPCTISAGARHVWTQTKAALWANLGQWAALFFCSHFVNQTLLTLTGILFKQVFYVSKSTQIYLCSDFNKWSLSQSFTDKHKYNICYISIKLYP